MHQYIHNVSIDHNSRKRNLILRLKILSEKKAQIGIPSECCVGFVVETRNYGQDKSN